MKTKHLLALLKTLHIEEQDKPTFNVVVDELEEERKEGIQTAIAFIGFVVGASIMALFASALVMQALR